MQRLSELASVDFSARVRTDLRHPGGMYRCIFSFPCGRACVRSCGCGACVCASATAAAAPVCVGSCVRLAL